MQFLTLSLSFVPRVTAYTVKVFAMMYAFENGVHIDRVCKPLNFLMRKQNQGNFGEEAAISDTWLAVRLSSIQIPPPLRHKTRRRCQSKVYGYSFWIVLFQTLTVLLLSLSIGPSRKCWGNWTHCFCADSHGRGPSYLSKSSPGNIHVSDFDATLCSVWVYLDLYNEKEHPYQVVGLALAPWFNVPNFHASLHLPLTGSTGGQGEGRGRNLSETSLSVQSLHCGHILLCPGTV